MEIGHVKFIRPKDPKLSSLIKGYYVHSSSDINFYSKITFYQNITTTISIYKNSKTSSQERLRMQHHNNSNAFTSLLVGLVDKYQEVEFHGPLDRLAIVFYPGGINHFIKTPLSKLLKKHYSNFSYFDNDFETFLPNVYSEPELENKRDLLDSFFLKHYFSFNEPELLESIHILTNANELIRVEELAKTVKLNRRTLLRKFKNHLGYSIEEYIAVIKFRKALLNFQQKKSSKQLFKIALESNYYDQADFNHHLKSRSGLTPKELFDQLNIVDDTLFWKV
jgi:AraC-like DNA-binding protein